MYAVVLNGIANATGAARMAAAIRASCDCLSTQTDWMRRMRRIVKAMPRKPKPPPPDDPEQSKRFIEIAREVGAEGTEEEFDKEFRKVASRPPQRPKRDRSGG